MSTVTVSLGYTMNIGNFESLRFDYGVTDDVRTDETIEQAVQRVEDLVETVLRKRIDEENRAATNE
jgi:hypothetical protein